MSVLARRLFLPLALFLGIAAAATAQHTVRVSDRLQARIEKALLSTPFGTSCYRIPVVSNDAVERGRAVSNSTIWTADLYPKERCRHGVAIRIKWSEQCDEGLDSSMVWILERRALRPWQIDLLRGAREECRAVYDTVKKEKQGSLGVAVESAIQDLLAVDIVDAVEEVSLEKDSFMIDFDIHINVRSEVGGYLVITEDTGCRVEVPIERLELSGSKLTAAEMVAKRRFMMPDLIEYK